MAQGVCGLLERWAEPGAAELVRAAVPDSLWQRLTDQAFDRPVATTRLSQWSAASQLVVERPWLGWGGAAFGTLYSLRSGFFHGHPHNLPLDPGLRFGAPVGLPASMPRICPTIPR